MSLPRSTRGPFLLLGLMTVASFGGPVAIALTIRGGASPHWPPDRAIEWWTFGLITGLVAVLLTACLGLGLVQWRAIVSCAKSRTPAGSERGHSMTDGK